MIFVRRSNQKPYLLYDDFVTESRLILIRFNEDKISSIAFNDSGQNVEKATVLKSLRLKYQEYHQRLIKKLNTLHQDMIDSQKEVRLLFQMIVSLKDF